MLSCSLALLGLLSATPNTYVSVADPARAADCPAGLRLRRLLALTPGVELAPRGVAAPIQLSARRLDKLGTQLSLRGPGGQVQRTVRPGVGWGPTLRALWPSQPPPDFPVAADLPGAQAIRRACAQDPAALKAAGAAWTRGLSPQLARRSSLREDAGTLRGLRQGRLPLTWRQAAVRAPDGLQLVGDLVLLFSGAEVQAVDLHTGRERWSQHLPGLEPHATPLPGGHLLLLQDDAALALNDAGVMVWRVPLKSPRPEVAARGPRVYVADKEQLRALSVSDGSTMWSFDPLSTPSAGPLLSGETLLLPADARLYRLDPKTGAPRSPLKLTDEVSGALVASAGGRAWALVGSDTVLQLDPGAARLTRRGRFSGLRWPPAQLGEALLIDRQRGRRELPYLLPPRGRAQALTGAGPQLSLGAARVSLRRGGRELELHNLDGRRLGRYRARRPITVLDAADGRLLFADDRVAVLMDAGGRVRARYPLPARPRALAAGRRGGVALLEDGQLYGLPPPEDPRIDSWMDALELSLGHAALRRGSRREARERALRVLRGGRRPILARQLLAEVTGEAAHWRAVLEGSAAPATRARAQAALDAQLGIRLRSKLAPGLGLAGAALCPGGLLSWSADRLFFRPFAPSADRARPRLGEDSWQLSRRGPAPPRCRGDRVFTDGQVYAAADGRPQPALAGTRYLGWGAVRPSPGGGIERLDEVGLPMWSRPDAQPSEVLAGDAQLLVLRRADAVIGLDGRSGAPRWRLPLSAPAVSAQLGPALLVQQPHALRIVDPRRGRHRGTIPLTPGPASYSQRGRTLWLAQGGALQRYALSDGRLQRTLSRDQTDGQQIILPSPQRAAALLWRPGQPPRYLAPDADRPAPLPLGPIRWAQADGPRWILWTEDDQLLVLRADR